MSMKMPKINKCDMRDCSYNKNDQCHALAITVGGNHPMCDTYLHASARGGDIESIGSVGACKVDSCKFNKSLECSAGQISVGLHGNHADCKTFIQR